MDAISDPEQLKAVLDLQTVETELRRLTRELADLEEQKRLDAAIAEIDVIRRTGDGLRLEMSEVEAATRKEEREIKVLRARLDAERDRLYSGAVTNSRENQAAQAEIKAVEERIDLHETAELELLEREDALEAALAANDTALTDQQASVEHLTGVRDQAASRIIADIAEHEVDIPKRRGELDAGLLASYDAAAKKRPGRAVGQLISGSCTACSIALPVAEANRAKRTPLYDCPNCGAMLITIPLPKDAPSG